MKIIILILILIIIITCVLVSILSVKDKFSTPPVKYNTAYQYLLYIRKWSVNTLSKTDKIVLYTMRPVFNPRYNDVDSEPMYDNALKISNEYISIFGFTPKDKDITLGSYTFPFVNGDLYIDLTKIDLVRFKEILSDLYIRFNRNDSIETKNILLKIAFIKNLTNVLTKQTSDIKTQIDFYSKKILENKKMNIKDCSKQYKEYNNCQNI